jgi:hypothetical protein
MRIESFGFWDNKQTNTQTAGYKRIAAAVIHKHSMRL